MFILNSTEFRYEHIFMRWSILIEQEGFVVLEHFSHNTDSFEPTSKLRFLLFEPLGVLGPLVLLIPQMFSPPLA